MPRQAAMDCQVQSCRTGKCATAVPPMATDLLRSADEKGFVSQGTTGSVRPRNFWDYAHPPASGGLDDVQSSPVGYRSAALSPNRAGSMDGASCASAVSRGTICRIGEAAGIVPADICIRVRLECRLVDVGTSLTDQRL